MTNFALEMLEYESVKQELLNYAVTYEGRNRVGKMKPMTDRRVIARELEETSEGMGLLKSGASVPLPSLDGIDLVVSLLGTGYLFTEQDLMAVQKFLQSCGQLRKYMASKDTIAPGISCYAASMHDYPALQQEILRCIRHGVITNEASKELDRIRRRIGVVKDKIGRRIQTLMSKYASILQESIISVRGGRYVIPVKKDYYRQVRGRMLDQSTSGQTVYIEPEELTPLQGELELLQGDEAREEAKVLGYLAELVERETMGLLQNIEITGVYDFILAKGKYALAIGGASVSLSASRETVIYEAKHPKLLHTMVPLDITIGGTYNTLIITGPNTGGKTVVLKTFGLLTLMVQSGLLVPVAPGSSFAVYQEVMAVIGDGQNLEQSLSTFSAQIQSLGRMLKYAGPSSLLLIDELAAGTDPGEGIALSVAMLEEFWRKGASVMVTTHFNELKTFAARTEGFQNARMEFDHITLAPLYRLTIGEAGQSYALEIAGRFGIPAGIIDRAHGILDRKTMDPSGGDSAGSGLKWDEILGSQVKPEHCAADQVKPPYAADLDHKKTAQTNPEQVQKLKPDPEPNVQVAPKLERDELQVEGGTRLKFEVGDAVLVTSYGKIGIVYLEEDARGIVGVMIQRQKLKVNRKRLKPYIKKEELYPEDYDFDIVFDTKENRKRKKLMTKRHVEGLKIIRQPE